LFVAQVVEGERVIHDSRRGGESVVEAAVTSYASFQDFLEEEEEEDFSRVNVFLSGGEQKFTRGDWQSSESKKRKLCPSSTWPTFLLCE